jgi:hypothetical protein
VWGEQAALTAQEGRAGDWFGVRVALSGQTVLVGAWYAQQQRGAAYVFVRQGQRWVQESTLRAQDGGAGQDFGTSVALSGRVALIGAGAKDHAAGAAYVFEALPAGGSSS